MSARRVAVPLAFLASALSAAIECQGEVASAAAEKGRLLATTQLVDANGAVTSLDELGPGLIVAAVLDAGQAMSAGVLRDLQSERLVLEAKGVRLASVVAGRQPVEAPPADWAEHLTGIPLLYDPEGKISQLLGTTLLPQTIVLDADRRLAATIGLKRASYLREVQRRVQEVLYPWTQRPLATLTVEQSRRYEQSILDGKCLLLAGRADAAAQMFERACQIAPHSDRARLWRALADGSDAALTNAVRLLEEQGAAGEDGWLVRGHIGMAIRQRGDLEGAADLLRAAITTRLERVVSPPAAPVDTPAPSLEAARFDGRLEHPPFGTRRDVPTVLLFWSAGDPASLAALSALDDCVRRAGRRRVEVITICVGSARTAVLDRLASVLRRAARLAFLPVWFDDAGQSRRQYGVTTLPTLVLVDVYGDVAARYAGDEPERLSDFLAAVRRLADDAARQNPTTQPADKASRPKTAYWTMAVRLAEARDSAGSAAALRKLLDEAPRHVAGRAFLAELLLSAGDVDEAEGLVTEGLQLAPSDACLLTLAGRCALARDEVWLAVRRCRRAVANDPALAAGHAYLGVALIRAGQIAEGREVIRRAVAIEPANARFWLLLGDAARSAGDRPAAVDGYERGFRLLAAEPCGLVDVSEPMR